VLFHLPGSHVDDGQKPCSGGCVDQDARIMNPRVEGHLDPDPASVPTLKKPHYSQSLERGLAILGVFTPEGPVLGIAEIAHELGMTLRRRHSSRQHLALTSISRRHTSRSRCITHQRDPPLRGHPTRTFKSRQIHKEPDRPDPHKIDLNLRLGSRLPVYCTSMGKVLLAYMPHGDRDQAIATIEPAKQRPNAITTKKAVRSELDHVHAEGIAVNDEELETGLISVAAPIRNESWEVVAAINLAAHTDMISLAELVDQLTPHLVATADHISARLGYRRDDETVR
jgi:IclR family transcriptional regulator, pca regulon regulatory protein